MSSSQDKGIPSEETAKERTYDLSTVEPYYVDDEGNEVKSEEDLSAKAKKAADSFYDLIATAGQKAKEVASQKTKEISTKTLDPGAISASKDAKDISALGPMVEELIRHFEGTMTEIRKQSYADQADLLTGYKKLLEEQIRVIDARLHYTKRL